MAEIFSSFLNEELWIRIGFSFFCGFIIGLERQVRGKPVGVRTASLICMASMSFIYIAGLLSGENTQEQARVLAQMITGIGFLGAGVIMNRDGPIHGLTSAAAIWILAALGAAIGFGYYGQSLAITLSAVVILLGLEKLESGITNLITRPLRRVTGKKAKPSQR